MNIASVMQMMNVRTPSVQTASNEVSTSSFKDILGAEQTVLESSEQGQDSGQSTLVPNISSEEELNNDPVELIVEDLKEVLANISMEDGIFKQPIDDEDLSKFSFLPDEQVKEIENLVQGAYSLEEIIEKMSDVSPFIGMISLLVGMDKLSERADVDLTEPLLKINKMFETSMLNSQSIDSTNEETSISINVSNMIKSLQLLDKSDFKELESHLTAIKIVAMNEQKRGNIIPLLKNVQSLSDDTLQFVNKVAGTTLENEIVQEIVKQIKTDLKNGQSIQSVQTIIESVISKFQSSESRPDVKTEITISLDQFVNKDHILTVTKEKVEPQVRQEFTNQLITAMKNSRFGQLSNGTNRLVIKLNPEHLGQLTIRLTQQNGEMVARIIASTQSAKELLEHSLVQLRHALPSVNVQIDRFEVLTESDQGIYREQQANKEGNEQSNEQPDQKQKDDEKEVSQSFKQLFTTKVIKEDQNE